ncbi:MULTISPECIES: TIR-like protein FxsC [Actinoplanes]|uniref:TIR-like protein FxsC n=1 Tax=Actinoplanes TaxID=1865 RepID=UPI0005F2D472|nr:MULTISPECIES: TIR-like protein FxsC [Actinoplanes]GLY04364.1 hypothetical protein Acsp01_47430 [Actinoplanes sp. NBRC 101535]
MTPRKRGDDTAEPVFFFSYARPARLPASTGLEADPAKEVNRFFADLTNKVNQLVPVPAGGDVGFMDRRLESGVDWHDELFRNLSGCRVFVALLSAQYVGVSRWCVMEWDYFSRREVRSRPGSPSRPHATAIIPVLWAPVMSRMPSTVRRVQQFSPSVERLRPMYESEGVLGMQSLDESAYAALVWILAREIQNRWAHLEVAPSARRTTRGLLRSFQDGA